MDSNSETTFCTLPTRLQLEILKSLCLKDQKSLRLVSSHTLALMNYLGASIHIEVDELLYPSSFNGLKTSPFSWIRSIGFTDVMNPLPISSSTRSQIPKANILTIGDSVSIENVIKLIRYHTKWCTTLNIWDTCFPHLKSMRMLGCSSTCLANVKTFCFDFTESRLLSAFGQFLYWSSMPSLQNLCVTLQPPFQWGWNASFPLSDDNKFNEHLTKFLTNHAPQLKQLNLQMPSNIWKQILPTLELMINVEQLAVREYYDVFGSIDEDLVIKAFRTFKKLSSLNIHVHGRQELIELLLENNKNTLDYLKFQDRFTSLSWFYQFPFTFSRLTYLHLDFDSNFNFDEAQAYDFKLESLYKLSLHILVSRIEPEVDWREPLIHWLIKINPNLQTLNLSHRTDYGVQPRSSDILALIIGLTRLKSITYHHYAPLRIFVDGIFQKLGPQISSELDEWLKQNSQLHVKLLDGSETEGSETEREYIVYINRPYYVEQPKQT